MLPEPSAVLELGKPITWFPPMWAFACGAVSTGGGTVTRWGTLALGFAVAGPLVCAASQAVNDWFDRGVDAINEPGRPIPSGRIPGRWGLAIAILWSLVSLAAGAALGPIGFGATALAVLLGWAYSAPPVRFKQNGWIGNLAVGLSYEGLAWVTGAAVAIAPAGLPTHTILLALAYSLGAHGIMTLNDFKSIAGDRRMGVGSLPATLGAARAAQVACVTMLIPQAAVIALLAHWDRPIYAGAVLALVLVQLLLMRRFLADPVAGAVRFSALGVSVYVTGMMVSAAAVRP